MTLQHKKNGGFTLVELVVTMGIAIAVIGLTCTILVSSFQFFGKENDLAQAKMIGDTIIDHMEDNLRYATALTMAVSESDLGDEANTYGMKVDADRLYEWETSASSNKRDVYGEEYYQGMKIVTYAKLAEKADQTVAIGGENLPQNQWLTIRLEVNSGRGALIYRTEKTFELVNITANIESAVAGSSFSKKSLRVLGNAATISEIENPVFSYDVQKVNHREDYNPTPVEMYNQVADFIALPEAERMAELREVTGKTYFTNDTLREYIRLKYYNGVWPQLSDYVDVAKYGVTYNGKNRLMECAKKDLRLTFHYDVATKSCVIFGITDNGTAMLSSWNAEFIYVPADVSAYADGIWYTYYPTADAVTDSSDPAFRKNKLDDSYKNAPQLYATPRYGGGVIYNNGIEISVPTTLEEYYTIIRNSWNPMQTSV